MQDILASIRCILNEDEAGKSVGTPAPPPLASPLASPLAPAPEPAPQDDILDLDAGLMVKDMADQPSEVAGSVTQTPVSEPSPLSGQMIAPEAAEAAAASMSQLRRGITQDRMAAVSRGGPTLDDVVREELRPLLKAWLDAHLPPIVERLVRAELERVSARVS
jgi:uncharacterized protein